METVQHEAPLVALLQDRLPGAEAPEHQLDLVAEEALAEEPLPDQAVVAVLAVEPRHNHLVGAEALAEVQQPGQVVAEVLAVEPLPQVVDHQLKKALQVVHPLHPEVVGHQVEQEVAAIINRQN